MKKWCLMSALALLLVLAACGGSDDSGGDSGGTDEGTTEEPATEEPGTSEGETAASGEEIYQANCAACHGADLSGGAGPDLTAVGSKYSQEEIADIVQNGKGSMPPQPVSGEDLDALTSWLAEQQ